MARSGSKIKSREKLVSLDPQRTGRCLWLDEVVESDDSLRYRFAWRTGNRFHPRPAHFKWKWIGTLIGKAMRKGYISARQQQEFLDGLGLKLPASRAKKRP